MKFKKPIASFDIESTGLDVVKDRICELSVCIVQPDGEYQQNTFRFNPEKTISAEAVKVHKITNEELDYEPLFKHVAQELFDTCFKGKDLHGYNIKRFDVCMLHEEFARCGIVFPEPETLIFDSLIIFQKQYPRDLASAFKHYTTKTLDHAHSAEHDVAATVAVFDKQIELHFEEEMTPEELAAYCKEPGMVDFHGKLIRNDEGVMCFNFGKSKDMPVKNDPGYARWMLNMDFFTTDTKRYLRKELGIQDPLAAKKPEESLPASSAEDPDPF